MRRRLPISVASAVAVLSALLGASCVRPPAPAEPPDGPADALAAAFDEERAFGFAAAFFALGPKVPGTPQAAAAADWIEAELRRVAPGAEVERVEFDDETPAGTLRFCNLVAKLPAAPGAAAAGPVAVGAHWDTKDIPGFAGANDGASGVAVLLELAAVLSEHPAPSETWLVFFDGEEARVRYGPGDGFHGSRRQAALWAADGTLARIRALILLDMVGDRDFTPTLPANGTPALTRALLDAAAAEGVRERCRLLSWGVGDDHAAFLDAGVPAVDLIDFEYGSAPGRNDWWHTPADTPDKLSAGSLGLAGRMALRVLARGDDWRQK